MTTKKIKFYKRSHIYKLGRKKLTSVTTFLGKYFKPFEAREIARKLAKFPQNRAAKRGVRYWLNQWKDDAQHGTNTHRLIEEHILGNDTTEIQKLFCKRTITKADAVINWFKGKVQTFSEPNFIPELIIYDEDLGLAGTIDLVVEEFDEETGDKCISLYDWKTNKQIKKRGYKGEKAKNPIGHMEDCNYSKYCLQLSVYAYMLEKQGAKIKDLVLVHVTEEGVKEYEIPYMKQEVEDLLND